MSPFLSVCVGFSSSSRNFISFLKISHAQLHLKEAAAGYVQIKSKFDGIGDLIEKRPLVSIAPIFIPGYLEATILFLSLFL